MKIVRSLEDVTYDAQSVVTVGTFDGVTLAHQEIIREVVQRARMKESRSVVVTFDPHPKEVVMDKRGAVQLLSTLDERITLLGALNIDLLFIINFTYEFSRLLPREFYDKYLVHGTGVNEVIVGYDHMFGRNRAAGTEGLLRMGQEYNFSVHAIQPFMIDGVAVSSTKVRKALLAGDIETAERFLGYRYELQGVVVRGDSRGHKIGFPTANLDVSGEKKIVPADGVYVVTVTVCNHTLYGIMNIGVRPTLTDGSQRVMEVHIVDFDSDIYDQTLSVTFLKRLRGERKFESVGELVEQLEQDRALSKQLIEQIESEN